MHPRQQGRAPILVQRSIRRVAPESLAARDGVRRAGRPGAPDRAWAWSGRALAALPLGLTLLPLSKTGQGWVRIWDFPRAQITVVGLLAQAALWRWGSDSRGDRILAAALAASNLYQIGKMAPYTPLYPRQVPDAGDVPADRCVRILMANVLQENSRSDLMLQAIAEADADIVCLVETSEWWAGEVASLDAQYPYAIRYPSENHYGMLLYSRLPIVDSNIRFIVSDDVPSIRAVVRLRSGDEVIVYAVHPPPPLPRSPSYGRDAELVLTGQEIAEQARPAVVIGDLNDVAWSYTASLFQRVSHMVDPRVGRGMFSTFDADHPLARYPLDHVFHTREFTLKDLRVMRYTGSDHFPILAELAYTPARKAEVANPAPTVGDVEHAQGMVDDAREAEPYVDEDGKGRVTTMPS